MVRPRIKMMVGALLAAWLLLPCAPAFAAAKSKADIANEKALADAQAARDKGFAIWQDTAQWRTVTPEELAMTSEPLAPGAAAVYLYTETERNNLQQGEMHYWQIKVLSEEGRNFANISFSYNQQSEQIRRIDARVIQPDGTIVPFSGEIYDRPADSSGQQSRYARSLTLPDVRVGSIIEFRYWRMFQPATPGRSVLVSTADGGSVRVQMQPGFAAAPAPRWILNQPLFTRHARYALQLYGGQFARWSLPTTLPAGVSQPRIEANNVVRMEARNMPQFVIEDYMPPADDLVLSVDFSYDRMEAGDISDPVKYWKRFGADHWESIEEFLGNPKYVSRRLDRVIAKGDSTEQKFRKIYDHVRQMGNVDIPGLMDEKAKAKCSQTHPNAWDVAEDRCGSIAELQLYFIALCRAAGLPAVPVRISTRYQRFFTPETADARRLDSWLVAITIDGREILLSPGVPFLPFGSLVWWDTAVPGLKPDKNGGTWMTTTVPAPSDAVTRRKAKLTLTEDGVLEGTVVVTHTGHEAAARVVALLQSDEQTRIDVLKEDLRRTLAVPADITVLRQPDWQARDGVLETEYQIKVQQWALTSGNRMMVGVGLFGKEQIGKFITQKREHPIYFRYPFIADDELEITLPEGFRVQDSPARQVSPDASLKYVTSVESKTGMISIRRSLTHNLLLAKQNQYQRVKSFYELVRSADQEQVVLTR
jgi:hypothetical protein